MRSNIFYRRSCTYPEYCVGGGHEPKILIKINYDENGEKMSRNQMVCEERCDEGLRVFKDEAIGTIRTIDSGEINV